MGRLRGDTPSFPAAPAAAGRELRVPGGPRGRGECERGTGCGPSGLPAPDPSRQGQRLGSLLLSRGSAAHIRPGRRFYFFKIVFPVTCTSVRISLL